MNLNTAMTISTVLFYILGFLCAGIVIWRGRTPQGTVAWVLGLVSFPFITVPIFFLFGRSKLSRFSRKKSDLDKKISKLLTEMDSVYNDQVQMNSNLNSLIQVAKFAHQPAFTSHNSLLLLEDGHNTYKKMHEQIELAKSYILFQFYIFENDETGNSFKNLLIKKAQSGVRVYFLYDEIGNKLNRTFLKQMREAQIQVYPFKNKNGWKSRQQINFRNHRKIIVIDGMTTFIGGLNIGDEYLGRDSNLSPWIDCHMMIKGPAALAAQFSFVKDWYWTSQQLLKLSWQSHKDSGKANVLVLHTGPVEDGDACLFAHLAIIHASKTKIQITTPYFIPSEGIVNALVLAIHRGVRVDIILPRKIDNRYVQSASMVYIEKLQNVGINFYYYNAGFIHQKMLLSDDKTVLMGSANLDTRSLFINFEILTITDDPDFISAVINRLNHNFSQAQKISSDFFKKRSFFKRLLSRICNLFAPML